MEYIKNNKPSYLSVRSHCNENGEELPVCCGLDICYGDTVIYTVFEDKEVVNSETSNLFTLVMSEHAEKLAEMIRFAHSYVVATNTKYSDE